jgi:hypothetical protein
MAVAGRRRARVAAGKGRGGTGVRLGFGRRDGVGGIRLGSEWWDGAFVKMARSVFVK